MCTSNFTVSEFSNYNIEYICNSNSRSYFLLLLKNANNFLSSCSKKNWTHLWFIIFYRIHFISSSAFDNEKKKMHDRQIQRLNCFDF